MTRFYPLICAAALYLLVTSSLALADRKDAKSSSCRAGWLAYRDKCFIVLNVTGTFSDADDYCEKRGLKSRTVTIRDEDEQRFVEQMLYPKLRTNAVWLGAHRQNLFFVWREDQIVITDGVYQNFAEGSPSYVFPRACMQMNSLNDDEPGKWKDELCFKRNAIACEHFRSFVDDDNDNDNDNDNDDDDDNSVTERPSRPTSTSTVRPSRPTSTSTIRPTTERPDDQDNCCKECMARLERMEMMFKNVSRRFEVRIEEQSRRLSYLEENNRRMEDAMEIMAEKLNQMYQLRLDDSIDISNNFTGIAHVLDSFRDRIEHLNEKIDDLKHDSKHDDDDDDDDDDDRISVKELKKMVSKLVKQELKNKDLDSIVNDIRLSYVNYRRALQFLRDGQWKTVGYV